MASLALRCVCVPIAAIREFNVISNIHMFSNDIYKYFLSCLKGKGNLQETLKWDCCSLEFQPEFSQPLTFLINEMQQNISAAIKTPMPLLGFFFVCFFFVLLKSVVAGATCYFMVAGNIKEILRPDLTTFIMYLLPFLCLYYSLALHVLVTETKIQTSDSLPWNRLLDY